MKCNRAACQGSLEGQAYYRIWNEIIPGQPSLYCVKCGRKIIEYSPELTHDVISIPSRPSPPVNHLGWTITGPFNHPITGAYRAESHGVTMSSSSLEGIRAMIERRIKEYPPNGHGNYVPPTQEDE